MITQAIVSARSNARQALEALMPYRDHDQVIQMWAEKLLGANDGKHRGDARGKTC